MGCEPWDHCEAQRTPTWRLAHLRQRRAYVYMLKRPLTALPFSPAASAGTSCKPWKRSSISVYTRLRATVCTSIAHHPRLTPHTAGNTTPRRQHAIAAALHGCCAPLVCTVGGAAHRIRHLRRRKRDRQVRQQLPRERKQVKPCGRARMRAEFGTRVRARYGPVRTRVGG